MMQKLFGRWPCMMYSVVTCLVSGLLTSQRRLRFSQQTCLLKMKLLASGGALLASLGLARGYNRDLTHVVTASLQRGDFGTIQQMKNAGSEIHNSFIEQLPGRDVESVAANIDTAYSIMTKVARREPLVDYLYGEDIEKSINNAAGPYGAVLATHYKKMEGEACHVTQIMYTTRGTEVDSDGSMRYHSSRQRVVDGVMEKCNTQAIQGKHTALTEIPAKSRRSRDKLTEAPTGGDKVEAPRSRNQLSEVRPSGGSRNQLTEVRPSGGSRDKLTEVRPSGGSRDKLTEAPRSRDKLTEAPRGGDKVEARRSGSKSPESRRRSSGSQSREKGKRSRSRSRDREADKVEGIFSEAHLLGLDTGFPAVKKEYHHGAISQKFEGANWEADLKEAVAKISREVVHHDASQVLPNLRKVIKLAPSTRIIYHGPRANDPAPWKHHEQTPALVFATSYYQLEDESCIVEQLILTYVFDHSKDNPNVSLIERHRGRYESRLVINEEHVPECEDAMNKLKEDG